MKVGKGGPTGDPHEFDLHPEKAERYLRRLGTRCAPHASIYGSDVEEYADCLVIHLYLPDLWKEWRGTGFSRSWAAKCAANFAIDFKRKTSSISSNEINASACKSQVETMASSRATVIDDILQAESRHELNEAINGLPKGQCKAVQMRFYGYQSFAEIGQILGISEDAAWERVKRALPQLRKRLFAMDFDADEALRAFAAPPP